MKNVHDYVNAYEFRSDGADHTPTENERAMLEDAIEGYLAHLASDKPKPTTPTRRDDWHYDSQGYCDNPGRGY